MIHEHDPDRLPDSDFEPGELKHLVPGNDGRMLDPRRTPVRISGLRPEFGMWSCEVLAFEDRGAVWDLPFESVRHFQFANGSSVATDSQLSVFADRVERFDRPLEIDPDPERASASRVALQRRRREVARWIRAEAPSIGELEIDLSTRRAPAETCAAFESFMRARGLWTMEAAFSSVFVSNPGSGECVKGHGITMAEIGLAPFRGTVVRDPATLEGPWSRAKRTDHILWRMAFVHEMLRALGLEAPTLYRGIASDEPVQPPRVATFVSATFSLDVATSMFAPEAGAHHGVLLKQQVPAGRLFMTYLETSAMNRQFLEAEAVLLHDPASRMF